MSPPAVLVRRQLFIGPVGQGCRMDFQLHVNFYVSSVAPPTPSAPPAFMCATSGSSGPVYSIIISGPTMSTAPHSSSDGALLAIGVLSVDHPTWAWRRWEQRLGWVDDIRTAGAHVRYVLRCGNRSRYDFDTSVDGSAPYRRAHNHHLELLKEGRAHAVMQL